MQLLRNRKRKKLNLSRRYSFHTAYKCDCSLHSGRFQVVIRRLPPRLTKDAFLEEFELPEHDYFCFVRGDLSMGQLAFSRAYVNFHKGDDIFIFKEKYDDYLLQDDQGACGIIDCLDYYSNSGYV